MLPVWFADARSVLPRPPSRQPLPSQRYRSSTPLPFLLLLLSWSRTSTSVSPSPSAPRAPSGQSFARALNWMDCCRAAAPCPRGLTSSRPFLSAPLCISASQNELYNHQKGMSWVSEVGWAIGEKGRGGRKLERRPQRAEQECVPASLLPRISVPRLSEGWNRTA